MAQRRDFADRNRSNSCNEAAFQLFFLSTKIRPFEAEFDDSEREIVN